MDRIIVATDDKRIHDHVLSFSGESVMTSEDIATGTDRCEAVARTLDCGIVVNIQGDEPLIDPDVIDTCIEALKNAPHAVCATPIRRTNDPEKIISSNTAKVAVKNNLEALYFSRSPIPFNRNAGESLQYFLHIGLYVYRKSFLNEYVKMKQSPMEITESLEQLRILENGYTIQCCMVNYDAIGVDTPEDLIKVKKILGINHSQEAVQGPSQ